MQNSTRPNNPELDATKVPDSHDIAWAAGIYEGEGHCRLCGKTKRGFMVSVVQKDPELLYRLRDWFGGSINGHGNKGNIKVWDCCGDRGRLFIALVYKFMTVRRKTQIDATGALDFLGGQSPVDLNAAQLSSLLDKYYTDHRSMVRERRRTTANETYRKLSADPNWRMNTNEYNRRAREAMTQEQKEASRKYQQDYYQRKKQKIHVVELEKTA